MFHNILNYLFILFVVSRAQETLTDEERGERLRKGFIVFYDLGVFWASKFPNSKTSHRPILEIRIKEKNNTGQFT